MHTYMDCVPCFFKQALDASILAGANKKTQKAILYKLADEVLRFDTSQCPTAMGMVLYRLVRRITGNNDPFKKLKQKSNALALSLYPRLKEKVLRAPDPLLAAIELAIAGNIIDYGTKHPINIEREIEKLFAQENKIIRREDKRLFDFAALKKALKKAKTILYIADNAGEIVFDRILMEELADKKIICAVRGAPIINDVLVEDALVCGIDKYAAIVSTGCDAPGAILKHCSAQFRRLFARVDLVISKGQGNYEALAKEKGPIFFLFRAKCPVIAGHLRCELGDIILKKAG